MAFSASQYLFKASIPTSTTTATVGAYTVPASTRGQIIALTITNTATTNVITYCDVSLFDGTTAYTIVRALQLFPGGCEVVQGVQKHVLPTGGGVYISAYATLVTANLTIIEVT